jgi:hypothetical protein
MESVIAWEEAFCSPFEIQPKFRSNMPPTSSGLNGKPNKKLT